MITDVVGLRVGHWTDTEAATGCTVVLLPEGTVASGEVRGGAPASRETALLDPTRTVSRLDALVLTGGSAFGLASADGVMRFCEERGMGVPTPAGPVPIVVALGLFDLAVGDPTVRPGPDQGYVACEAATAGPVELGRVGAGTGATVGAGTSVDTGVPSHPGPGRPPRAATTERAETASSPEASAAGLFPEAPGADSSPEAPAVGPSPEAPASGSSPEAPADDPSPQAGASGRRPGGLVSATARSGDLVVSALVAVNAFGVPAADDAIAPDLAATLHQLPAGWRPAVGDEPATGGEVGPLDESPRGNTVIGLVATNARLDKMGCHLVAQSAHDGLARAVFPAHTSLDGDAFVAAAVGTLGGEVDVDAVRILAVQAVADAIRTLA